MIEFFIEPFSSAFITRALVSAVLVSVIAALIGVWVVIRGMAFMGEAMSHGMLPGVAIAALLGGNIIAGATISAIVMAIGVNSLRRFPRLAADTSIGLLYAGMLSIGVIIVSQSKSFAVDLTAFLFGDVLAASAEDINYLLVVLVITLVTSVIFYRPLLVDSFDSRKAKTLGLRPELSTVVLFGMLTLAVGASFHVVGTLLAFAMLIAPAATGVLLAKNVPMAILLAAITGILSSYIGILISWYYGTAAGATISAVAVTIFFIFAILKTIRSKIKNLSNTKSATLRLESNNEL